jgi:peptide-methionine (S)-S-oxide reductase
MNRTYTFILLFFLAIGLFAAGNSEEPVQVQKGEKVMKEGLNWAVLGGGCFWCVEAVYERIDGIEEVVSGYAGGTVDNPTYKQVTTGLTGHAEVVKIYFDPEKISYEQVINVFWQAHDPTTLNRQGADVGTQYRSIILPANEDELAIAKASMERAQPFFNNGIVTEIKLLETFYEAEDYHQDYYDNNVSAGYCRLVIQPKLNKLGLDPTADAEQSSIPEAKWD